MCSGSEYVTSRIVLESDVSMNGLVMTSKKTIDESKIIFTVLDFVILVIFFNGVYGFIEILWQFHFY
jgi:hypothetical protein